MGRPITPSEQGQQSSFYVFNQNKNPSVGNYIDYKLFIVALEQIAAKAYPIDAAEDAFLSIH